MREKMSDFCLQRGGWGDYNIDMLGLYNTTHLKNLDARIDRYNTTHFKFSKQFYTFLN